MSSWTASHVTAASLAILGSFQAALAAGAPWGRAAYGGTRTGTLPGRLRAVSGVASVAYLAGAAAVMSASGDAVTRRRAHAALAAFMAAGTLANGASRSPVERALWTPVCAVTAVASWRARPAATD